MRSGVGPAKCSIPRASESLELLCTLVRPASEPIELCHHAFELRIAVFEFKSAQDLNCFVLDCVTSVALRSAKGASGRLLAS
jgi:hypothetical protein